MPPPPLQQVDGTDTGNVVYIPSSPLGSFRMQKEFESLRSVLVSDIKGVLQDMLYQHEVLIKNQELSMKEMLAGITLQAEGFGNVGADDGCGSRNRSVGFSPVLGPADEPDARQSAAPPSLFQEPGPHIDCQMALGNSNLETVPKAPKVYAGRGASQRASTSSKKNSKNNTRGTISKPRISIMADGLVADIAEATQCAAGACERTVLFGTQSSMLIDHTPIDEDVYNVQDFYYTDGTMQWIARSSSFASVTLAVICLNAVYMGFDADHNDAPSLDKADAVFIACENLFCTFFSGEIIIRLLAFRVKCDCLRDGWFKFDMCLVILMVMETWILPLVVVLTGADTSAMQAGPVRLIRLLRLAKMTRLMRALPELVTMVKGMFVAGRAVFSTLLMLVLLIYVYAIVMLSFLKNETDDLAGLWCTVSECMWSLLLDGVFLNSISDVARQLRDIDQGVALFILLTFILFSAITIMNMLIGVLCEVVTQVAHAEKENNARADVRETILGMLRRLDVDGSGDITKEELLSVVTDPVSGEVLCNLDVDIHHFIELQDMFFEGPDSSLTVAQILNMILELRGSRPATMQDLINGHAFTRWSLGRIMDDHTSMLTKHVDKMMKQVTCLLLNRQEKIYAGCSVRGSEGGT